MRASRVYTVGVAGGSCSGKSTIARLMARRLGAVVVSMDDYYKGKRRVVGGNFDRPGAVDFGRFVRDLRRLQQRRVVRVPVYDFAVHERRGWRVVRPRSIIIVEGLFVLRPFLLRYLDVKVFLDIPVWVRYGRRIGRDIKERRRTVESVKRQWRRMAVPMEKRYVAPTRRNADIVAKLVITR